MANMKNNVFTRTKTISVVKHLCKIVRLHKLPHLISPLEADCFWILPLG